LSAAFAGVDEFHQTFVPSRTGQFVDVGWDSLGAALALIAYYVFQRVRGKAADP
jgi:VanZ family protein